MAKEHLPNRWGIGVAVIIMQICLGAVYGWSVFKIPLMRAAHRSETAVQLNFSLAIFFSAWERLSAAYGRNAKVRAWFDRWQGWFMGSAIFSQEFSPAIKP